MIVDPAHLADITDEDLEAAGKIVKQNIKALRGYAERRPHAGKSPDCVPVPDFSDRDQGRGQGREIVLGRNELVADEDGRVSAKDTGDREELPAQLVVRAVGYRGVPTPGLPFDENTAHDPAHRRPGGRPPQRVRRRLDQTRADRRDRHQQEGLTRDRRHLDRRSYRGAKLADFHDYHGETRRLAAARQPKLVTDEHWKLIDEHERSAGESQGRPRVKLPSFAKLLRIRHG